VRPIKAAFVAKLEAAGWQLEHGYPAPEGSPRAFRPGAFDAFLNLAPEPSFVVEWETGNISSSHRALNKIALGMLDGWLTGGYLVLPSRSLYQYLTDRVGNYREIEPYLPLWKKLAVPSGLLGVIEFEHDATSRDAPRIEKGTDGRALL
jgi:hypothetical protein